MKLKQGINKEYLYNTKIKVTPEQSEILQKALFELGFIWGRYDKTVSFTVHNFLFIEGYKDKAGKLLTMELDAAFTKEMIRVLSVNKTSWGGKYKEGNHYKPMNPKELLASAERHLLEVKESFQNNNITDIQDDDNCSHLAKIAVNCMMTWIQLKNNK